MKIFQFLNSLRNYCADNDEFVIVDDRTKKILSKGKLVEVLNAPISDNHRVKNLTMLNTDGDKCKEYSTVIVVTNVEA